VLQPEHNNPELLSKLLGTGVWNGFGYLCEKIQLALQGEQLHHQHHHQLLPILDLAFLKKRLILNFAAMFGRGTVPQQQLLSNFTFVLVQAYYSAKA
jgi:hypothetical protein